MIREFNAIPLGKENVDDRLKGLFLLQNPSFIEDSELSSSYVLDKVCNTVGFEPLHILHLGISKLLNECTFKILCLDKVITSSSVVVE